MGINVLPKNSRVALKGELSQLYGPYDTDQDGALSPVEVSTMEAEVLRFLLEDIIDPKNDPQNNNHKAFISALPPASMAKLFQKEICNEIPELPKHIYGDFMIGNPDNVAAVMHILIQAGALDDADTFLKGLSAREWKNVFMALRMMDPANAAVRDYVSSRTKLDYAALQMRGEEFLEADKDQNGLLDALEVQGMEKEKTLPPPDLFKMASTSQRGHIPFHYLLEELTPLLAQVVILHAASGAKEGMDQSIDFLNNLAYQNTERFVETFEAIKKELGAEKAGVVFQSIAGFLNENVRRDLEQILGEALPSITAAFPPSPASQTPFVVEGLTSVDETNFEKEVQKPLIPVLIFFGAEWCENCQNSILTVKALAKKFEGRIKVVVVDSDKNPDLAIKWSVTALPTFLLLQRGKEMKHGRVEGFKPELLRHVLEINAPKIEKI